MRSCHLIFIAVYVIIIVDIQINPATKSQEDSALFSYTSVRQFYGSH